VNCFAEAKKSSFDTPTRRIDIDSVAALGYRRRNAVGNPAKTRSC
jgi:hypothetical protein